MTFKTEIKISEFDFNYLKEIEIAGILELDYNYLIEIQHLIQ